MFGGASLHVPRPRGRTCNHEWPAQPPQRSLPLVLANIARVAVWDFAIVVAVDRISIARELVNPLFMARRPSAR
jgi:hypothetical protein